MILESVAQRPDKILKRPAGEKNSFSKFYTNFLNDKLMWNKDWVMSLQYYEK